MEVENARILTGPMRSICRDRYGAFTFLRGTVTLNAVVNSEDGWELSFPPPAWEHVSVSLKHRTPTWEELCFVTGLFWEDHEIVMQFRPSEADYVNHHPHCLHLWRPVGVDFLMPPTEAVGPRRAAMTGTDRIRFGASLHAARAQLGFHRPAAECDGALKGHLDAVLVGLDAAIGRLSEITADPEPIVPDGDDDADDDDPDRTPLVGRAGAECHGDDT